MVKGYCFKTHIFISFMINSSDLYPFKVILLWLTDFFISGWGCDPATCLYRYRYKHIDIDRGTNIFKKASRNNLKLYSIKWSNIQL